MEDREHRSACGRPACTWAVHRSGQYTMWGIGHLDQDGHYEYPCRACAAEADSGMAEAIEEARRRMKVGKTDQSELALIDEYLTSEATAYMRAPAWPWDTAMEEADQLALELVGAS